MRYTDFVVPYNENPALQSQAIIHNLILSRLKYKKPFIMAVTAGSGEGKSFTATRLAELILSAQGLKLKDYMDDVFIFTPGEYRRKIKAILYDERLKDLNFVIIDEAKEVVNAKDWNSFANKAISHINKTMRRIKRVACIFVVQSMRDLDIDVRYTLNYQGKCIRPLGKHTRLYVYRIYEDDSDLERIKLKKRRIFGFVKKPSGRRAKVMPKFIMTRPEKDIVKMYHKLEWDAKVKIINRKLDALLARFEDEEGAFNKKIALTVDFYLKKPELLEMIVDSKKKRFSIKKEFVKMHKFSDEEVEAFKSQLFEKLKEKKLIAPDAKNKEVVVDVVSGQAESQLE